MPWHQFLDEAAAAGYSAVELGPFGYLPTHPEQLRDELGRRGLTLTGATAGTHLHRGADSLAEALAECRPVAALLAAMDAPHLITLPAMYTDLYTGDAPRTRRAHRRAVDVARSTATPSSDASCRTSTASGRCSTRTPTPTSTREDRIETFLDLTDPATVSLCLDTGHVAYAGGDNRAIVARHPDRIGYVHLKSVDPDVLAEGARRGHVVRRRRAARRDGRTDPGRARTCRRCSPTSTPSACPLMAIVEHDMYPAPTDAPLPIATRTRRYYSDCGLRTART